MPFISQFGDDSNEMTSLPTAWQMGIRGRKARSINGFKSIVKHATCARQASHVNADFQARGFLLSLHSTSNLVVTRRLEPYKNDLLV